MSIWTSIQGILGLETSPLLAELDTNGLYKTTNYRPKIYLPYPEKQFKLLPPEPFIKKTSFEENKSKQILGLEYGIEITSFPIIEKIVSNAIKKIPGGEHEYVEYTVSELNRHRNSSSDFSCTQVEKIFKETVLESNKNRYRFTLDWEELNRFTPICLSKESHITESYVSIFDDIRSHEASEIKEEVLNFLFEVVSNNVDLTSGNIKIDDLNEKYLISIKFDKITVTRMESTYGNAKDNYTEYYQIFTHVYSDRPNVIEIKKVDEFEDNYYIMEEN